MSLKSISKSLGVKFFDDARSCISHFEKTHWTKRVMSFIQSIGALFVYNMHWVLRHVDAKLEPFTRTDHRILAKKRLVVGLHGLNSNPAQFKTILAELQKKDLSETDIFIPQVLKKGNTKLDKMVKPIFQEITKWARTSGKKELVLVGISNGGRIGRAIEAKVAQSKISAHIEKIRFVSIVGACKGSALANLAHKLGLSWLMSKHISKEMPTTSERTRQLNREWKGGLSRGPVREYTFIASPHDWVVTNYSSSLMKVRGYPARYAIVPGHGHNSIVNAIAKVVAKICLA